MARNKEYERMLAAQAKQNERKSWVKRLAEGSKQLDKYQIIAGGAMILYGAIFAATGAVVLGAGVAASSLATRWAANRVIAWDERRQSRKRGEVKQVSRKKKSELIYTGG